MAKKSKGFRSLLKQQKLINRGEQALNKFEQKFKQSKIANSLTDIVKNPKGEVKMSEVLEEFVEPYLPEANGLEQRKMVFEMAVIAWNLAIIPKNQRKSVLEDLFRDLLKGKKAIVKRDLNNLIDEMVDRKLEFFLNNRRYILDCQLEDAGDQFHLSVASTLAPSS
ncbi:hypothetical protein [Leptothoe spongobia]|uniref:Uncharacterized protein n=1 Tax=Leptothoe spongobia TAU-MAC 1115 TaxID=1967444 RepID=A0A947DFJ9_9CYAN|nr:hypothetical protein [Leptothoe spongobia]MBT9316118.1 hypothetical protein [Leptothoe spongobia TAU-MAC 1115]